MEYDGIWLKMDEDENDKPKAWASGKYHKYPVRRIWPQRTYLKEILKHGGLLELEASYQDSFPETLRQHSDTNENVSRSFQILDWRPQCRNMTFSLDYPGHATN